MKLSAMKIPSTLDQLIGVTTINLLISLEQPKLLEFSKRNYEIVAQFRAIRGINFKKSNNANFCENIAIISLLITLFPNVPLQKSTFLRYYP